MDYLVSPASIIALAVYFIVIVLIGVKYSKRAKTTNDYILADRGLTTPFVTASVTATWIGGAVILGGATNAFTGGFQSIVWDPWSPVLTLLLSGFLLVTVFRKSKFLTIVDYYNSRFNKKIGTYGIVINTLALISWLSAQLLSRGVVLSMITGLSVVMGTILGAIIILAISLVGGLWALSRSDMLAFIIITISLLIMVPYAFSSVGGVKAFIENAGTLSGNPPFALFYSSNLNEAGEVFGFDGYTGMLGILYMLAAWFSVALGDAGGPVLTARALAAKDEATASKGFIFGGLFYLVLGMIPVIIGMCVFILKPNFPEANLDNVLPWFLHNYVPEWLMVMFLVALASAIVSTAGDTILSTGAMLGNTGQQMINPEASDRSRMLGTRICMVILTILALIFGLLLGNLYNLLVFAGALGFPTMAAVYICGIVWKKTNNYGAYASMVSGMISWAIMVVLFLPAVEGDVWESIYMSCVPAFLVSLVALIAVSALTQKQDPPNPIRDIDGNDISDTKLFVWSRKKKSPVK